MQPEDEIGVTSRTKLWAGRLITALTVAFLLFDAMVKVFNLPVAVEGTVRLGYPARLVVAIGIVELICLAVYLYPRTAVLGAILLTAYLGGATATQARVEDPWFIFPVVVGVLVWAGLFLRSVRLRSLLPLQSGLMKAPALVRVGVLFVLLLIIVAAVVFRSGERPSAKLHSANLEYLKSVNSVAPPKDPELLFILMTEFANSNLQGEGAEFFSARLKEFDSQLTPVQKSLYLGIIGLLRAQHASAIPLLKRSGYVKETIATLDQAKQFSGGQVFVVNWIAGVVHTELPAYFGQRRAAQDELAWCAEHADKAPHPAWLREVYYHLGKLARNDGDTAKAQEYLQRSGYSNFDHPITLATPFSEEKVAGHAFAPRRITEIVPGRVYVMSGFEFTEYYFIVSKDRRQLVAIDAGTRPDFAKGAYEALQAYAPGLPALTTVFVTHAHWDHVGGHSYFRGLNPRPKFYGRDNYQEEFEKEFNGPGIFAKPFFGERFSPEDVVSYKPDVTIDKRTDLNIGGSKFELIPIHGGETHDAQLIYLADEKVMFMGDTIMPYLGAPFAEEGDLQGLLDAIDIVVSRNPQHLLHGHEPLTRNFTSALILSHLKTDLTWLRDQVLTAIRRGDERAAIHEANLIPPDLPANQPDAHFFYNDPPTNVIYTLSTKPR